MADGEDGESIVFVNQVAGVTWVVDGEFAVSQSLAVEALVADDFGMLGKSDRKVKK